MSLTECECIWKVNYVSKDDGHNLTDSYWTDLNKAEKRSREIQGRVNKTCLWRDNANNYYEVKYTEVMVDVPTREQVLAKLSPKERKVLGV